jgi:hypothetical protein
MLFALIPEGRNNEKMSRTLGKLCTFNSFRWSAHLARCLREYSRFRSARVKFKESMFQLLRIGRKYRREHVETPFYARRLLPDQMHVKDLTSSATLCESYQMD